MSEPLKTPSILSTCQISNNQVWVDGALVFQLPDADFGSFAEAAYQHLEVAYPKFHKMDNLAKLGFLTSEFLLKDQKENLGDPARTGIVVANRNSSLDTDLRYMDLLQKGVASPALFVYTLPNILVGEICIRNGLKGENTCFVAEKFDPEFQVPYVASLLQNGTMDVCLAGWVDFLGKHFNGFLSLIRNSPDATRTALPQYTHQNISALFKERF